MNDYIFVEDEIKDDNVVMVINDFYDSREICEYMIPVPEITAPNYEVCESSDKLYDISYALWVLR